MFYETVDENVHLDPGRVERRRVSYRVALELLIFAACAGLLICVTLTVLLRGQ